MDGGCTSQHKGRGASLRRRAVRRHDQGRRSLLRNGSPRAKVQTSFNAYDKAGLRSLACNVASGKTQALPKCVRLEFRAYPDNPWNTSSTALPKTGRQMSQFKICGFGCTLCPPMLAALLTVSNLMYRDRNIYQSHRVSTQPELLESSRLALLGGKS